MSEKERANRRDFLKLATTAAPAAAAAVVVAAPEGAEAVETADEGLRLTEQRKKYYDSARF